MTMIKTKNILIPYFLAILISLFASLPLFHGYLEKRAILAMEEEELEREEVHVEEMVRAESELLPYIGVLNEIQSGLPSNPALPSLIRYLEGLVVDSGLQLSNIGSFSTSELPERSHLKETTIEVEIISNNYSSIKSFMRELERSIKLINISRVLISPVVGEEGEAGFSLFLSLKTYSY